MPQGSPQRRLGCVSHTPGRTIGPQRGGCAPPLQGGACAPFGGGVHTLGFPPTPAPASECSPGPRRRGSRIPWSLCRRRPASTPDSSFRVEQWCQASESPEKPPSSQSGTESSSDRPNRRLQISLSLTLRPALVPPHQSLPVTGRSRVLRTVLLRSVRRAGEPCRTPWGTPHFNDRFFQSLLAPGQAVGCVQFPR